MTHPRRRAKLEKVTIHLTPRNADFVRKWSAYLGISVGEYIRRILCETEEH